MAELDTPVKKRRGNPHPKPPIGAPRASAWLSSNVYQWMRDRIAAAGGDPTLIPEERSPRLMRLPEVTRICGISTATVYTWAKAGRFPRPIPLDTPVSRAPS